MLSNFGGIDRTIRIVVGLVMLSVPFWLDTPWHWLGLIGLIPLNTGLASRCRGYRLLGLSTCSLKKPG
ncbi:MAG: DUF2892 domain-containing protein [Anaerolineales bacterium]|nr:DUF2892 domain-containing protein [Anaerolineales bacterium]